MKTVEVKNSSVADILISANLYNSKQLKDVAIEKIRNDREILKDEDFRQKIENAAVDMSFILDLFYEI